MNPLYNILNTDYIQQQALQYQKMQELHIAESCHKMREFLNSLDKIDPANRQNASIAFCAIICDWLKQQNQ